MKGNIIDEASRTPVAGAVILLQSDRQIGTVSDSVGNFRLTSVPLGRQSFIITIIGYEPVFVNDILVTAGKGVMLNNVMMNESISTLDAVVITANSRLPNNEMAVVSTKTFNMDETKRYAGSIGDPARMTANFAGVISTNDTRNDIIIRGNSPNSMLWQLEGLNIPNPNHFGALNSMGGSVSMLNNNNIDKSDFIAGAFPAQYGNALAGAFDIRLRNGNDETHEFVTQVGFNGFEAGAEGPIGQKNKATYIVNARYSTLAVFQQLGLEFGTGGGVPIYADINYKVNTPIGERASVSLFGIWGRSDWTSLGKDYDPDGQAYGNDYSNRYADYTTNITGASLDYRLGKNTTAKFTLGYSSTNELFDRDSISTIDPDIATPDWHWKFVTRKYSAVLSVNHKFNAKHSIVGGLYNDYIDYSLLNKRIHGGTADAILVNRNSNIMLTQAYVQWKYRFNETFTFIPGLHYQRLDISKSQSIEPRIGISARVNNNHTLVFGFGMHSQMDNLLTYATVTKTAGGLQYTNESLGFLRSNHFVLSHDWRLSANTRLKTEVYYQSLYDLPVESKPSSFSTINLGAESTPTLRDSLVNEGTGRNYGLEITLERRFSKGLYYLLTTSLFDSKYKGSDRILRNTAFNMGYVVNALAGKEWSVGKKSIIGVSLKLSTVGGRYLSPIDIAASTADGEVQYVESEAFSIHQGNYFRTDIKLSYRRDYKKSSLEISLDLQNVTNNENIFRQEWNSRTFQITNNYQQGFFPVPFIRFTF
ncbi:TonB-dependent receptor [Dyadobacter sp. CY312]|uniref:TonB-dependent receptor n=1 Tax=Dyadobacter sp. CY312 TaxID=2907303 RepID=UPI001F3AD913|nr:TonB-dependent receptor [Dyadobacter sp. CY312]MCE7043272.1 TonB-dependent receptor [Dyadobacter sp. CY312]